MSAAVRGLTAVWAVLLLATLGSGWLAGNERGLRWAGIAMLLIASAKIALIVSHFMEVRSAPMRWRLPFAIWLCLVTAVALTGALFAHS